EHRRTLAALFVELAKALVYDAESDHLLLTAIPPPKARAAIAAAALRTIDGVHRFYAPQHRLWSFDAIGRGMIARSAHVQDNHRLLSAGQRFVRAALRLDPTNESARLWLGLSAQASGRLGFARDAFRRVANSDAPAEVRACGFTNLGVLCA